LKLKKLQSFHRAITLSLCATHVYKTPKPFPDLHHAFCLLKKNKIHLGLMVLTVTATQPLFTIIRASRNHQTATNHPPTPRQKPPCEPSTLFHTSTCTTAAAMASHAFSFTSQPRSQPPPNHFKPCPRLTTSTIVTIKQPPNDRRAIFHFLYEATPFSSLFCAFGNPNASNQNNLSKENGLRGWLGLAHFPILAYTQFYFL